MQNAMASLNGNLFLVDGSFDFSGGVDSIKVTTIQSPQNPHGLGRNQLAWLINGTVRDGGIIQRLGWLNLGFIHNANALFQGGYMYEPRNGDDPYLVLSIGGHIYKVVPGSGPVEILNTGPFTAKNPQFNPATAPQAYFVQAEEFLIIQAGDNVTLPLFYDGNAMRRSIGIVTPTPAQAPGQNEIPAATAMDYYMGRVWFANGRQYSGGDIVGGPSGTAAYGNRDSVLSVTEAPLCFGGDGFTVPSNSGNIRALRHSANLDTALGQGQLFIFTRKTIYSLDVPIDRNTWVTITSANQPLQKVVQIVDGSVNDRSVVGVNGDLYYQSLEPGIRSLVTAVRYFQQPGNVSLSAQEQRVMDFQDRALMHANSGIYFDNRLLQCAIPIQTPEGIVCQCIVPLDFVPMSSFGEALNPTWEGMYEGLDIFQLFTGDFGGRDRAFAMVRSRDQSRVGEMDLWELTDFARVDFSEDPKLERRVTWIAEFPAYTAGKELELKKLVSAEIWVDKLYGDVMFTMEYRPDSDPCWQFWHTWQQCSARNSCEDVVNPICYPLTPYRESYRSTMVLPRPPERCESATGRPSTIAYQFQPRLTVKGWCRIRAIRLFFEPVDQKMYHQMVCGNNAGPSPILPGANLAPVVKQ